jgi:anthranilate synthase/indole-3-glycerol phosphate synthase/phosphoribosylanthranilate isomerase
MLIALECGSRCIGINNRNLHSFKVDMGATERLTLLAKDYNVSKGGSAHDVQILALSGISTRSDVERFEKVGVNGILVGEALMKASDPAHLIDVLVGRKVENRNTRVKVCGIQSVEAALCAAKAGADYIGVIFAKSKRQVSIETASDIVQSIRAFREDVDRVPVQVPSDVDKTTSVQNWFTNCSKVLGSVSKKPLVVGVFMDQGEALVADVASKTGIDIIQLHGDEGWEACAAFDRPVFRVVHVGPDGSAEGVITQLKSGLAISVLLDTQLPGSKEKGGTGVAFDWSIAAKVGAYGVPVVLAGGLTPDNVAAAIEQGQPWAVDVSSGVETDGVKDLNKIKAFVTNAKKAS